MYCQACQQAEGSGLPEMYPPSIKTDWVTGDKERLVKIVLEGIKGPIEVKGEKYNSIMPPQNKLRDQEVSAIMHQG